jgi:hypothetical protein
VPQHQANSGKKPAQKGTKFQIGKAASIAAMKEPILGGAALQRCDKGEILF